jgi:hypothetical protein
VILSKNNWHCQMNPLSLESPNFLHLEPTLSTRYCHTHKFFLWIIVLPQNCNSSIHNTWLYLLVFYYLIEVHCHVLLVFWALMLSCYFWRLVFTCQKHSNHFLLGCCCFFLSVCFMWWRHKICGSAPVWE